MKRQFCVLSSIYIVLAAGTGAAEWRPIQGKYAVTAANYLDPAGDEPNDSHIRFQLSGQTAKDIFLSMKVPESKDECTGAMSRKVGEMQCLRYSSPERYECAFSVNVMTQKVEYGVSC